MMTWAERGDRAAAKNCPVAVGWSTRTTPGCSRRSEPPAGRPRRCASDRRRALFRGRRLRRRVARYLAGSPRAGEEFPENLVLAFERTQSLRYGENPHQRAALYREAQASPDAMVQFQMLQGKELSFNNLLDLDSAVGLARDLDGPAAVIVKHNNPCGGDRHTITEAFGRAFARDPLARSAASSPSGVADGAPASLVLQHFVEVVAADDHQAIDFFGKS